MTKRKMTVVAVLLTAMAGSANAAIIYDTFVQVNIYYGVVQVYSPTSVLLSTTEAMTVETQFPYSQDVAAGQGALLSYFMPLMAQSVGQQLANDPIAGSPPIPAYISTNLAGFENSTGFGAELDDSGTFIPPDPNTSPTPSALELYQMLTSQPFNYMVTGTPGSWNSVRSSTTFMHTGRSVRYPAVRPIPSLAPRMSIFSSATSSYRRPAHRNPARSACSLSPSD